MSLDLTGTKGRACPCVSQQQGQCPRARPAGDGVVFAGVRADTMAGCVVFVVGRRCCLSSRRACKTAEASSSRAIGRRQVVPRGRMR
jgi:hypothetical protein